jgi:Na+-driven multidrug efflux pump
MNIVLKVFLIIYVYGLIAPWITGIMQGAPFINILVALGFSLPWIFLLAPLYGIGFAIINWQIAIPYYAVAFGLLYWWEKRKRKTKMEENVV